MPQPFDLCQLLTLKYVIHTTFTTLRLSLNKLLLVLQYDTLLCPSFANVAHYLASVCL